MTSLRHSRTIPQPSFPRPLSSHFMVATCSRSFEWLKPKVTSNGSSVYSLNHSLTSSLNHLHVSRDPALWICYVDNHYILCVHALACGSEMLRIELSFRSTRSHSNLGRNLAIHCSLRGKESTDLPPQTHRSGWKCMTSNFGPSKFDQLSRIASQVISFPPTIRILLEII